MVVVRTISLLTDKVVREDRYETASLQTIAEARYGKYATKGADGIFRLYVEGADVQKVTLGEAFAPHTKEDYDPFKQGIEPLGCDPDELEF